MGRFVSTANFGRSNSRRLKFLDEVMDSIARRSRREEFLHRHFQHFGKIKKRFVVDARETRFDLANTAAADIETGKLELGRKI